MKRSGIKVIMVTNYYFPIIGGISTYIDSLEKGLLKKNYDTQVINYPVAFRNLEKKVHQRTIRKLVHSAFVLFFMSNALIKILKNRFSYRTVIVHSHSASFCLMISIISKAYSCGAIHTYHSPLDKYFKHLDKLSPKADAIVFVSNEARKFYQSQLKIKNDVIEIIPGVIDENKFYPRSKEEIDKLKKNMVGELGKSMTAARLILFVGRVTEEKGIRPLIESLGLVDKKVTNFQLIIVGPHSHGGTEKKYYDELLNYIDKHDLVDKVKFAGPVSTEMLMNLYAVCDIFVAPSIWEEPSGIVPIEAMASGKPVIASKVGGLQHRIVDGKTGYLVEKNNPGEIAEKITLLLGDNKLLEKMSKGARTHIENNYTLDIMTGNYKKLYESVFK